MSQKNKNVEAVMASTFLFGITQLDANYLKFNLILTVLSELFTSLELFE